MEIYYIERPHLPHHHAGAKPRNDINDLLKDLNFIPLTIYNEQSLLINSDDIICFQYPFYGQWDEKLFNDYYQKGLKLVLIICDVHSIIDPSIIQRESRIFNQSHILIVSNQKFKEWLFHQGVISPIYCLGLFDYLVDDEIFNQIPKRYFSPQVCFAGCLNPRIRKFIYDRNYKHDYLLFLYGPELEGKIDHENTYYGGSFSPEKIPAFLQGSFGLMWNGDSVLTCTGLAGQYSKLVTSHKLSLYLLSGLPVICWEESAEANLIKTENLGFTIRNLNEIDDRLSELNCSDYEKMLQNISSYSMKLKQGFFFEKVMNEVLLRLKS